MSKESNTPVAAIILIIVLGILVIGCLVGGVIVGTGWFLFESRPTTPDTIIIDEHELVPVLPEEH